VPVAHDLLREWIGFAQSALVIYDRGGGYRRFLGADPRSAQSLQNACEERVELADSFVVTEDVAGLSRALSVSLQKASPAVEDAAAARRVLDFQAHRYYPQMLDWVADEIEILVREEGACPGEIVVLAPFLSDALRFSLINRLESREIAVRSHRPSRALREETATQCLLTLAALAHPAWGIRPTAFDVASAMMQAIEGMDLVRAQLLTAIVYRIQDDTPTLSSFDEIQPEMQERLTYVLGERYEGLRGWLEAFVASSSQDIPLDHFVSRLFGEVLSQSGYGFHRDFDGAEVAANLVESVRKFRWVTEEAGPPDGEENRPPMSLGQEYMTMVEQGVIAAQYVRSWHPEPDEAVLLAPAYTFLIRNRPVDYQFWLDIGSLGWWERLYQPLTNPYVYQKHWGEGAAWNENREFAINQAMMAKLVNGLLLRCQRGVFAAIVQTNEFGAQNSGPLLKAFQKLARKSRLTEMKEGYVQSA